MASKELDKKEALKQAFWDTLDVALWAGIPATGIAGLLLSLSKIIEEAFEVQVSGFVALIPYFGPIFNTGIFFVKRYREYVTGKKELAQ